MIHEDPRHLTAIPTIGEGCTYLHFLPSGTVYAHYLGLPLSAACSRSPRLQPEIFWLVEARLLAPTIRFLFCDLEANRIHPGFQRCSKLFGHLEIGAVRLWYTEAATDYYLTSTIATTMLFPRTSAGLSGAATLIGILSFEIRIYSDCPLHHCGCGPMCW
jgi:hypothetical protein